MLFQLDSVHEVVRYWGAMLGVSGAGMISSGDVYQARSYLMVLIIAAVASTPVLKSLYSHISSRIRGILTPVFLGLILVFSTAYMVDATYNPFLYFRF